MTDLRAIELAVLVLKCVAPLVELIVGVLDPDGDNFHAGADELTLALFKLQVMHFNLKHEGIHHIEA